MTCPFAHLDAVYVLGALSAAERKEYDAHLADCEVCSRSVRDLAGLPGLLSRIEPDVLVEPATVDDDTDLPEGLLPALLADVRRERRRSRWTGVLAAAAAAVVAVGGTLLVQQVRDQETPAPPAAAVSSKPMSPVGEVPVRADLALSRVAWGTKLELTCSYPGADEYHQAASGPVYVLTVTTKDGHTQQVGTWRAVPGKTMHVSAGTAAEPADISSVQVRTTDGKALLRLRG